MSEVTVFEDKLVAKFVAGGALLGFVFSFLEPMSESWPWWGNALFYSIAYGVLALVVFGAVAPLIAWFKYFRVQRGMGPLESFAMVAGGLVAGGVAGLAFHYLTEFGKVFPLLGWVLAGALIFSIVSLPYYWVKERKDRKSIPTYVIKE